MAATRPTLPAGPSRGAVSNLAAAGGGSAPSAQPPEPHTTPFAGAPGAQAGSWTFRSAEGMAQPQFSRPEEVPGFASTVLAGSASAGQQSQPTQGPPEAAGQVAIPTSAPSGTLPTTAKDALSTPPTSKAPRRAKT
jgi:hypothetical protein